MRLREARRWANWVHDAVIGFASSFEPFSQVRHLYETATLNRTICAKWQDRADDKDDAVSKQCQSKRTEVTHGDDLPHQQHRRHGSGNTSLVYRRIGALRTVTSFSAWMFSIVRHEYGRMWRQMHGQVPAA
nr:hypothetical protein [Mesorhizobium sp.]